MPDRDYELIEHILRYCDQIETAQGFLQFGGCLPQKHNLPECCFHVHTPDWGACKPSIRRFQKQPQRDTMAANQRYA